MGVWGAVLGGFWGLLELCGEWGGCDGDGGDQGGEGDQDGGYSEVRGGRQGQDGVECVSRLGLNTVLEFSVELDIHRFGIDME